MANGVFSEPRPLKLRAWELRKIATVLEQFAALNREGALVNSATILIPGGIPLNVVYDDNDEEFLVEVRNVNA